MTETVAACVRSPRDGTTRPLGGSRDYDPFKAHFLMTMAAENGE